MASPNIATVTGVSKRFILHRDKSVKERLLNFTASRRHRDDFWALRDINLEITLGSTVGLVGHNGSGKSTLLKVIGGIVSPSTGVVARRGRMAALLELGAGFHQDLTGRENVYLNAALLGLSRKETDHFFDAIVDFSGIEDFIDTQVKFYSSGMYVRLAFAVAVHVDPDLLLVDEVLAVGDEPFQRKCLDKIAEFQREGRAIVLVSHALAQVGNLCDRVVVLDHGVVKHDGDTSDGLRILRAGFEEERQRELSFASAENTRGTADLEILEVSNELRTGRGKDSEHTLNITTRVRVNTAGLDWGIGFTLSSSLGLSLYEANTFGMGIELPRAAGEYSITVGIPRLNLGEGQYGVDVGLGLSNGKSVSSLPSATTFVMGPDPLGGGVVRYETTFAIKATK